MCFLFCYTLSIDVVTNSFLQPLFLLYIDINVLDFCFVFVCSFVLLFVVVGMNPEHVSLLYDNKILSSPVLC